MFKSNVLILDLIDTRTALKRTFREEIEFLRTCVYGRILEIKLLKSSKVYSIQKLTYSEYA